MSSNEPSLVPFGLEGSQIRDYTGEKEDPWFVGVDICNVLGIASARRAMSRLEKEAICFLNPTGLEQLLGKKARITNEHLAACGLQVRNQLGEWELTDAVSPWGEAPPSYRGANSGYQSLWNPAVVAVVQELG